jgi:cell wall-associated NlpC family hydrolase
VWAAAGPNTFDCSGFTMWAWAHGGKSLSLYTGSQLAQSRRISAAEAQPGDLVFFWGPGDGGDPGHVGLYLGGGSFVHAPGRGKFVRVDSVGYWSGARVAYGRV